MKLIKLEKKVVIVLFIILSGLVFLFLWACGGIQLPGTIKGQVYDFGTGHQPKFQTNNKIIILTWNIAYAHGFGSEGKRYIPHNAKEMSNRIKRIGDIIRNSRADVVLLQEIDFDSHRSHNVDQLRKLSRITGLRYAARAVTWKAGYVPFPYWPPNHHFGAMCSGGAVLSRYPITINHVTLHPKPKKNPWWYNAFSLFRYTQEVKIHWGKKIIWVINNHLESFNQINRVKQANALVEIVGNYTNFAGMVIVGGDMNTIPPEATVHHGYPDGTGDDYRGDTTMYILRSMSRFKEVVKKESCRKNESAFFTFPAHAPNRRLDYLFVPKNVLVKDVRMISTGDLSDHLPVRAELIWLKVIKEGS